MKARETISGAVGAVLLVAAGARAATLSFGFDSFTGELTEALILAVLGAIATHYALKNQSILK